MRNLIAGVAAQQNTCDSSELLAITASNLIAKHTANNRAHACSNRIYITHIVTDWMLRIVPLFINVSKLISRVGCR